jgi:hypothetical protein
MSNTRKPNGSPLLREVLFKAPAPVSKTKKSLNDKDEMYKHPSRDPRYAHLFPAKKAEAKSAKAEQTVTEETTTPKPNNP